MGGRMPTNGFNLVTAPWLRVLDEEGRLQELSLQDFFLRLGGLRRLAGESAAQDAAVLRVILVILWRATLDDPDLDPYADSGQEDWWRRAFLGEQDLAAPALSYLDRWHDRFELLTGEAPFMQVAGLRTEKGGHSDLGKLIPDAESDYFTVRAGRGKMRIGAGEAARWLIFLQAWSYAGIKSGVVGDPRMKGGKSYPIGTGWSGQAGGIVLHGRNMRETLLLNTAVPAVYTQDAEDDLPVWERRPDGPGPRDTEQPTGPCDHLTWQICRARLVADDAGGVVGVLVSNGDRVANKNQFTDPMTAYRYSRNQSTKITDVFLPQQHDPTRTVWRGVAPLLALRAGGPAGEHPPRPAATVEWLRYVQSGGGIPGDLLVGVELVGMVYGTNASTYAASVHDELPLQLEVLAAGTPQTTHLVVSAAQSTQKAADALGWFARALTVAAGRSQHESARGHVSEDPAVVSFLAELNEPFKGWLAGLRADSTLLERDRWFQHVRRAVLAHAAVLARGAGPAAVVGREDEEGRLQSTSAAWGRLEAALRTVLEQSDAPGQADGEGHARR